MTRYRKIVSDFRYPPVRLRSLLRSSPQYGANERGVDRHDEETPRYIRITDIDRNGQLIPGLGVAAEQADPRYSVQPNDLLIARSGNTVGKSLFIDAEENAIFAGYLIRFPIDPMQIQPRFVFIYAQLPIYWKWIEATRRLTGQPNVNAEEYGRLELPKPPLDVQKVVVGEYDAALASYKAKMEQADALLASIDDYLLAELGITLPPEPENTIDKRMFRTKASDLGGWRFDPHALEPDVEACREKTLAYGRTMPLRRLVNFVRQTSSGRSDDKPYIGLENIQGSTGFLFDPETDNEFGTASVFEEGDVLFPKLRPYLNKVYFAEMSGYCSTEFHVLRPHSVLPEFLSRFLRSKLIVRQTKHLMTGNTLPRLQTRDIEKLLIPLPSEEHQMAICREARNREIKARQLQREAGAELERAKADIEAILLGDAA